MASVGEERGILLPVSEVTKRRQEKHKPHPLPRQQDRIRQLDHEGSGVFPLYRREAVSRCALG